MYHGERLNVVSHLVGTVMALMGFGALLAISLQTRDPWIIASFGISYRTSFHVSPHPRMFFTFWKLWHASIRPSAPVSSITSGALGTHKTHAPYVW